MECDPNGIPVEETDRAALRGQALRILGGKVSYVRGVNARHGKWLGKLLALAKDLASDEMFRNNVQNTGYSDEWKNNVLKYKDDTQDMDEFLSLFDYMR